MRKSPLWVSGIMLADAAAPLLQVSNPLRLQQWRALQCEADMNRDAGPVEAGFAPDSGTSSLNGAKVRSEGFPA